MGSYRRRDIRGPDTGGRPVPRRDFLRGLAVTGGTGLVASALGPLRHAGAQLATPFPDGVKAGDPQTHGAVLWSRVAPPVSGADVDVFWTVATDQAMQNVVTGGITTATAADGHMVKVVADRLAPDSWHYYRFESPDGVSPGGRVRTAPRRGVMPDRLRYAFASCQQRTASVYVAHKRIAEENVDFLMHLGDYIYVSDGGDLTIDDYRRRWRIFHSNPLLQDLQAKVPLVPMWDDGEFYNGVDRTGDPVRLAAARQAWFEHMPVRPRRAERVYRSFRWGKLAEIMMIDVRSYRDPEVPSNTVFADLFDGQDTDLPGGNDMFLPERTTLGARQKRWLLSRLGKSRAIWKLVGNPYNINPWKILDHEARPTDVDPPNNEGIYVSNEAWDDYQAERRELLGALRDRDVRNVVFTSGHTHVYVAAELQPDFDDPTSPVVAFDFVTGSQTADPDPTEIAPIDVLEFAQNFLLSQNTPYLKYVNIINQGYAVVDATPEETVVDFRVLDTYDIDAQPVTAARFRIIRDARAMERLV